jgi:hypothetical protein
LFGVFRERWPVFESRLWVDHIEVAGRPPFKDAKVFPGGAREWDWRETGTFMCLAFSLPTFRN